MSFQGKMPFFAFLQGVAAGTALEEAAPAENYILDERVPDARENEFFSFNDFPITLRSLTQSTFCPAWFKHHVDYAKAKVALPAISGTFTKINEDAWLPHLSPDWDVVRIETISGFCSRPQATRSGVLESEARDLIQQMLAARETKIPMDAIKAARLEKWFKLANIGDRRPVFVAPFAGVEDILNRPDWANRLRDAFGLGHIVPTAAGSKTVVLLQYNLIRVHNAHIGKPAWAASPTVLDDVPGQMPNPCFFPAPKNASKDGCGYTVDLAKTGASFQKEFLHGHITYTLADIRRIGEVTTDVPPSRIADARKDHLDLLKGDLVHFTDLKRP